MAQWAHGEDDQFYKTRIETVLKKSCWECHSHASGEASGKLMLDSSTSMQAGGTRGAVLVAGKPDESILIKALTYQDPDLQMPPDKKLPDEVIEDFRKWIADGAKGAPEGNAAAKSGIQRLLPDDAESHWAYRVPQEPKIPTLSELHDLGAAKNIPEPKLQSAITSSLQSSLDAILLAEQLKQGVLPSAKADRRTLVRRIYYDLVGLPPTESEIEKIQQDQRSTQIVFEELVDRLIASSHFGERWTRYWMDVARYADTKGYVFREDREYPQAFKYRQWLIEAFNKDLPYTDFVRLQLAGDTVDADNAQGQLPALGFLTLGRRFLNNKNDIIDDRLDVTMRGLMGLTLACARCHDHKYDPVSQADYYALYGVFLNTEEPGGDPWPHRMTESQENRKSFILIRGTPGNRGAEVNRRFVSFLSKDEQAFSQGSGRNELAAKITDPLNPLTARVMVNRIWMRLVGTSIVDSPSDFGVRCPQPPLQPVLDFLAVEFMNSNWSMKDTIRRIVLSGAYQQQSLSRSDAAAIDPENRLLWKMNRRRMDFESQRDAVLSVSGQLDSQIGGPSEKIHEAPYSKRRTVYAYIDRQNLPGIFRNFDMASPDAHSPQRLPTTVPQQGLYWLNSGFVTDLSHNLASQIESHDKRQVCEKLFEQILARTPNEDELNSAMEFLNQTQGMKEEQTPERWICAYGSIDGDFAKVTRFERLPKYTGTTWQGGDKLPDDKIGWCMLTRIGGHPGTGLDHVVIRRWIAPKSGVVSLRGTLKHPAEEGDGVRGTLVSSRHGKLGQWTVHHKDVKTSVRDIQVEQGDAIDLVTDCQTNHSHDSFEWKVKFEYASGGGTSDSFAEFPAPRQKPLNAVEQLAQALLSSNEFVFID